MVGERVLNPEIAAPVRNDRSGRERDWYFGTVLAFGPGKAAGNYKFTSALAVRVFKGSHSPGRACDRRPGAGERYWYAAPIKVSVVAVMDPYLKPVALKLLAGAPAEGFRADLANKGNAAWILRIVRILRSPWHLGPDLSGFVLGKFTNPTRASPMRSTA